MDEVGTISHEDWLRLEGDLEVDPQHPKYAVLHWSDWEHILGEIEHRTGQPMDDIRVPDAEVIRHQDITAAPTFFNYSSTVIGFRDLLIEAGVIAKGSTVDEELTEIADHFHWAGSEATLNPNRRLPT